MRPLPWPEAWHQALYAVPDGFYVRHSPAAHFATSANGPGRDLLARALLGCARETTGRWPTHVVEIAAGRGELLQAIAREAPGARVLGVDVVDRPVGLPGSVDWLTTTPRLVVAAETEGNNAPSRRELQVSAEVEGVRDWLREGSATPSVLLVAHEWLDVVPHEIVARDADGVLRQMLVGPDGTEALGDPAAENLDPGDLDWLATWWPDGERIEIGRTRDEAWAAATGLLPRDSTAIAVDYGHTRGERPAGGSLAAYRDGVRTHPVPDGSCDITTHVAVDSLGADELVRQRDAITRWAPASAGAGLAALHEATARAHLTDPSGLGRFWWAITRT